MTSVRQGMESLEAQSAKMVEKLQALYDRLLEEKARKQRAEFEARLAKFKKPQKGKRGRDLTREFAQLFPGGGFTGGGGGNQGDSGGGSDFD